MQCARVAPEQWLDTIRVEFWSAEGYQEAGIDGGGLFKYVEPSNQLPIA
jgi:hypothetical protein